MSGEAISRRSFFCFLIIVFLSKFSKSDGYDSCLNFRTTEIEDYLSKLNVENARTIDRMVEGSKGPVTGLPFGALQSDWARLLFTIKRTRSNDTVLAEKLARLFRILLIAYYRTEKRFDVVDRSTIESTSPSTTAPTNETISTNERKLTREFATSNVLPAPHKLTLPITESSISTFNTSNQSISKNVNDSIPTFAVTDLPRLTTLTGYKKSITENVEDKQTTNRKSIFAGEVNATGSEVKGDFERTKGRGDFSVFHDSSNLLSSYAANNDRSRGATRYRNAADTNIAKFRKDSRSKISRVESATRGNHIYSNILSNKVERPVIFSYPRSNNDFWKYIVNYTFAPSTIARSISETENTIGVEGNFAKFNKGDDTFNGNVEQNFRSFYNFDETDKHASDLPPANPPKINVECDRRAPMENNQTILL